MKLKNIAKMVDDDNKGVMMGGTVIKLQSCSQGGLITFGVSRDVMSKLIEDSTIGGNRYSIFFLVVDKIEEKKYEDKKEEGCL